MVMPKSNENVPNVEAVARTTDWRGSWLAQAAGLSSFISPALGMVSITVGYSWQINITKAMVAANIGGVVGFAGSLFGIFGGYKDHTEQQAKIAAEIQAMPIIRDSGINTVTCITNPYHNYRRGYYLRQESEMTWVTIVQENEARTNLLLDHNPHAQLFLSMIHWPANGDSKVIEGNLGIALANLIESHSEYPHLPLAPVAQSMPEQMSNKKTFVYGSVVLLQVISAGLCLVESVAYSYSLTASSNDATTDGYIDPILPEGYVLASTAIKTLAIFCASGMAYYQSHELKELETTHSHRRLVRNREQTIANEKQQVQEIMDSIYSYNDKMQAIPHRGELLFRHSRGIRPDVLKEFLIEELKNAREVLDVFGTELQRSGAKSSQPILSAIKDIKLKIKRFSEETDTTTAEEAENLHGEFSRIFHDELIQISDAFRSLFLEKAPIQSSKEEDVPSVNRSLTVALNLN